MTKEVPLETRARQMMKTFRAQEWLGLAAGLLISAGAEVLRIWWAPGLSVRMVHSWFLPVVGAASLLAIYLSVSMHKALKERSAVDRQAREERSCTGPRLALTPTPTPARLRLLEAAGPKGLRLMVTLPTS